MPTPAQTARLAEAIAADFYGDGLKLPGSAGKVRKKWAEMREVGAVEQLRESGADDREVCRFLTFVAAMTRRRDFRGLMKEASALYLADSTLFDPLAVTRASDGALKESLKHITRNQGAEFNAWKSIASALSEPGPVTDAVENGEGDAVRLLWELDLLADGKPRFPLLKGEKIGPLWVKWLVTLGGARLENLDLIPVAVDTHIRKVSKELGIAETEGASDYAADPAIRAAWLKAVDGADIAGPPGAEGTCAALDPALWALGKYGCDHYKGQP